MNIPLPEDLEHRLGPHLPQLCQRALEAYTNRLMSAAEVQALLQLPSHLATDARLTPNLNPC